MSYNLTIIFKPLQAFFKHTKMYYNSCEFLIFECADIIIYKIHIESYKL